MINFKLISTLLVTVIHHHLPTANRKLSGNQIESTCSPSPRAPPRKCCRRSIECQISSHFFSLIRLRWSRARPALIPDFCEMYTKTTDWTKSTGSRNRAGSPQDTCITNNIGGGLMCTKICESREWKQRLTICPFPVAYELYMTLIHYVQIHFHRWHGEIVDDRIAQRLYCCNNLKGVHGMWNYAINKSKHEDMNNKWMNEVVRA